MRFLVRAIEKILSIWVLISCIVGANPKATVGPALAADRGGANSGRATSGNPYVVPETESRVRVDAVLDEEAWNRALVLNLDYEVQPGENVSPPVRTQVLLTFDREYLYAGFRCYDPDPSEIRAHLSDRDHVGDDDCVGIVLDTFDDQRRSFDLLVNPLGVQEDFIEAASGDGGNWDAIWESAGRITDWGYAVEMSVPFNQLRFQRKDGPQTWGFDGVRRYPRSQRHHIGTFPRDRSNNCYLCQAIKIQGFKGATPGYNIEISPTLIMVRTDARRGLPAGDFSTETEDADPGLTARWGVSPNLTLSGALNPDFSQVEADARLLDINQPFALYFSEKRPFFTEGADFFQTLKSAIYTRTMHDPTWGLKLSGKEGTHTVGLYAVQDDATNLIFPGSESSSSTSLAMENTASVFRYKRDIGSHYTLGALATDREGAGYYNRVVGLDCDLRITPTDQIQVQVLGSRTQYPNELAEAYDQPTGRFDDAFVAIEYDHESRSAGWWLDYDHVGTDFRADLGFIPMVDYRNVEGGLNYTWNAEPGSWWSSIMAGNEINYYEDQRSILLAKGGALWLSYQGAHQSNVYLRGERFRQAYHGREFNLTYYRVGGGFRPARDLRLELWSRFGDHIDFANTRPARRLQLSPYCVYNLGRHLRLVGDHTYERLTVEGRRLYTAHISEISATYQFTARSFFRSILQYVDYEYNPGLYTFEIDPKYEHFFTQLLFSYKINPRTVLFLGYSDNHFGSSGYDLTQNDRTFFAKMGYAWTR